MRIIEQDMQVRTSIATYYSSLAIRLHDGNTLMRVLHSQERLAPSFESKIREILAFAVARDLLGAIAERAKSG